MTLEPLAPETRNLIDGALRDASDGGTFDNVNPATDEVLGTCANATRDDVQRAVAAARRAFDQTGWSENHAFRARCLRQLLDGLREAKEQLRSIVVHEAGAPVSVTPFMQVDGPIEMLDYWAALASSYEYERRMADIPFLGTQHGRILRREAAGVVGAITPWNVPLYLNIAKIGPALAAGCTVVLKPAPDTPWSATHLGKVVAERTDIPRGVLNIVASADHLVGEILSSDPRIDLVTFTGSTRTGRRIMECASATVKKLFLELGGKSANIVFKDAHIGNAVKGVVSGIFAACGQTCVAGSRLLVERSMHDEFVAKLVELTRAAKLGDPMQPATQLGPVTNRPQLAKILDYIAIAKQEGAQAVIGGRRPADEALQAGWFVEPTIFTGVGNSMRVAREEIFGPVLSVIPFADEEEAVAIANDSTYGLAAGLWTSDLRRALRLPSRLQVGTVWVNTYRAMSFMAPFGGYKQSGIGKESGQEMIKDYLQKKTVWLSTQEEVPNPFILR